MQPPEAESAINMPASNEVEQEPLLQQLDSQDDNSQAILTQADDPIQPRTAVQDPASDEPITSPGLRAYVSTVILFLINLLNYVDRYTIAGKKKYIEIIIVAYLPSATKSNRLTINNSLRI